MLISEIPCKLCGKVVHLLDAVDDYFCSRECAFDYYQQSGMSVSASSAQNMTESNVWIVFEETLGDSRKRARMRYNEMTSQAILRGSLKIGRRSIIIAGYGANLSVLHESLVIKYCLTNINQEVTVEKLDRATHRVHRIVWCAESGILSYEALKWCQEQSIDIVLFDGSGNIVCESNNNMSINIRVKRAQHNISQERKLQIATWLILGKIMGQYETFRHTRELYNEKTAAKFSMAMNYLSNNVPRSIGDILVCEMQAADSYFDAWRDVPLRWVASDRNEIPAHWLTIGKRNSPLSRRSAKRPIYPAHAILNYAYGILEHATRVALGAVGLDPAVGIVHVDRPGRDSLMYDLMELGRGKVDEMVLAFIRNTEFRKGDFVLTVSREVRLHPELTRAVCALCTIPYDTLLEKAQQLRNMILIDTPEMQENMPDQEEATNQEDLSIDN